jgi:hypothetical protein
MVQDHERSQEATSVELRRLRKDDSLLHFGARVLASMMGVASVVGVFSGAAGIVAGAIVGGIVGAFLSRSRRYRSL